MNHLRHFARYILDLMRELADQTAYERFLTARGTTASASEWRAFSDQRHAARFRRAKCC